MAHCGSDGANGFYGMFCAWTVTGVFTCIKFEDIFETHGEGCAGTVGHVLRHGSIPGLVFEHPTC